MTAGDDEGDVVVNEYGRFTMVPNEIVLTLELTPMAKVLYMHLVQMANEGLTVRSRKFLGERLGRAVDTVDRALKELTEFGALRILKRTKPDGSPDWSEYRLIIIRRPKKSTPKTDPGGSRKNAATGSRKNAAGGSRKNAAIEQDLAESKNNPPTPHGGSGETTATPEDEHRMFDQVYAAYPKHEDRQAALIEWYRVIRSGKIGQLELIIAARAYADHVRAVGIDLRFVKNLANWLRAGSYDNPIPEPPKSPYQKLKQAPK